MLESGSQMIGQTIKHYRIIDKLGEGGMAEVYLAEDTKLSRMVALKVLPQEMAEDPTRIKRFEREAKAIAALNHPNIVTIYSVEEADGLRFLTMELVDGKSFEDLIPESGLDLDQFFDFALPLVEAVGAAHRRGITHRDIKPANVMLNTEGVVKLLDLGLAKHDPTVTSGSKNSSAPTLTQEGRAIGTIPYMAPEQLAGKQVDHRVDIFALGVVLYEMITGRRPFMAGSSAELISAILRDTPKQVTELNKELPNTLNHTIRRCLEKDPAARFQSAEDLRVALQTAAAARPQAVSQRTGHETVRMRRQETQPIKVHWLVVAAVAVSIAVLVGTVLNLLSPEPETSDQSVATTGLTLAIGTLDETGSPGSPLSADLTDALRSTLGEIDGLEVSEGGGDEPMAGEADTDYRIGGHINWTRTDGLERARLDLEMVRLEDGAVIWSERFEPSEPASPGALDWITGTVRTRVGGLLGLRVPPTPRARTLDPPPAAETPAQGPPTTQASTSRASRIPSPTTRPPTAVPQDEPTAADQSVSGQTVEEPAADPLPGTERPAVPVSLSLASSLSSGVVTIYADTRQIYRRSFEFSEPKSGVLGRVGLKKRVAGELEDDIVVPAGTEELRVYVAVAQEPARQIVLSTTLRADGTDRLHIEIRENNDIEVTLE